MIAQIAGGDVLTAAVTVSLSVLGGGFTIAWRLGSLERLGRDLEKSFKDIERRVGHIEGQATALQEWLAAREMKRRSIPHNRVPS